MLSDWLKVKVVREKGNLSPNLVKKVTRMYFNNFIGRVEMITHFYKMIQYRCYILHSLIKTKVEVMATAI